MQCLGYVWICRVRNIGCYLNLSVIVTKIDYIYPVYANNLTIYLERMIDRRITQPFRINRCQMINSVPHTGFRQRQHLGLPHNEGNILPLEVSPCDKGQTECGDKQCHDDGYYQYRALVVSIKNIMSPFHKFLGDVTILTGTESTPSVSNIVHSKILPVKLSCIDAGSRYLVIRLPSVQLVSDSSYNSLIAVVKKYQWCDVVPPPKLTVLKRRIPHVPPICIDEALASLISLATYSWIFFACCSTVIISCSPSTTETICLVIEPRRNKNTPATHIANISSTNEKPCVFFIYSFALIITVVN